MKRWTFNLLAALSLVLGVATAVMWVRSYWRTEGVIVYSGGNRFILGSVSGTFLVQRDVFPTPSDHWIKWVSRVADPNERRQCFLGSLWCWEADSLKGTYQYLFLPKWSILCPTGFVLVLWLRSLRRARPGFCPTCGYDLRESPQRCPECGAERDFNAV